MKHMNLQLFGEGGAAGASGSAGTGDGTGLGAPENLESVIYGKPDPTTQETGETVTPEDRTKAFEEMIKGDYKEAFDKRVQGIINKRFGENRDLQKQLDSHAPIMSMLAERYGIKDPTDLKALTEAMQNDTGYLEEEALKEGLTVEQLKQVKELQRENEQFRRQAEEATRQEQANQTLAKWMAEADALKAKYGIDFDLQAEAEDPEFINLLTAGVSVESAWKVLHADEIEQGLVATATKEAKKAVVNSVKSRQSRPAENGTGSQSSRIFKTDVNSLTPNDINEILNRVARGEQISF